MRWHPLIIKWCISTFSKSPKAYDQLSKAGFVKLPTISTLKSYTGFTDSIPDGNPNNLEIVGKEFKLATPEAPENNDSLVLG